jgi:hypothetical protein
MSTRLLNRTDTLKAFFDAITAMLEEKKAHYGEKGGFFETNAGGDYTHATGEIKLKLGEFFRANPANPQFRMRLLVKAATWIYLIFEDVVEAL